MIEIKDIYKRYDNLEVLKGVNLKVEKGEIVSIVGKSGAGKSTLLHILGTLDQPSSDSVIINGRNTSTMSNKELANFRNQEIGFIFQFHHLLPEFNALENVCIPAFIQNADETVTKARAKELLVYLGLGERLTHRPSELSGGEQQRVAVARALINSPAVIFADEPSGNLDMASSEDLHKLLFQLRDDFQHTFVIVTHNPELAEMSDRKLTIADGQIV